jgi:hypothetical protein
MGNITKVIVGGAVALGIAAALINSWRTPAPSRD